MNKLTKYLIVLLYCFLIYSLVSNRILRITVEIYLLEIFATIVIGIIVLIYILYDIKNTDKKRDLIWLLVASIVFSVCLILNYSIWGIDFHLSYWSLLWILPIAPYIALMVKFLVDNYQVTNKNK